MKGELSSWRVVGLVARREVTTRTGSKVYRIITAAMLAVLVVGLVVVSLVGGGGSSSEKVGLTAPNAALSAPMRAAGRAVGQDVQTRVVASAAEGRRALRNGHLDALLVGRPDALRVAVKKDLNDGLRNAVNGLARQRALDRRIAAAGGDPAQITRAVAGVRVPVHQLEATPRYRSERLGIAIIVGVIIYIALITYGQTVAQGVVEEKASRVVELLLSTIRAWQLMAGKVLGIGVVGLAQIVVLLVAGVVTGVATGLLSLPASIAVGTVVWSVVWFLLGFFLYALLFAAAGALVSRQEDVGTVSMPMIILIIVPFVLGVSTLPEDPANGLMAVLSIVPLFAPMLMPMRLALGVATAWQAILAVVLAVALIVLLVALAGRVYRNAVMRVGARVPLRDALRSA